MVIWPLAECFVPVMLVYYQQRALKGHKALVGEKVVYKRVSYVLTFDLFCIEPPAAYI